MFPRAVIFSAANREDALERELHEASHFMEEER